MATGEAVPTHHRRRTLLIVAVVIAVLCGAWFVFQWLADPPAPSAFYTPPSVLQAGPPGTVIRSEAVPSQPSGGRAWRVLYTSTAPDGAAIAVSGVVVAPLGPAPPGGWPVVAWAHGTSGVASRCAPSLVADGSLSRVPELAELLAAGTAVAATDYPGLGTPGPHPYLVGESEGRAVLDSVRAARSLLGADASATSVIYGHSQGGHAALFADALAPSYAPELKVAGVAAMAPPTDLGDLLERDKNEAAGIVLTALALTSWKAWYPDVDLRTVVYPEAEPLVERVGKRCVLTTEEGISDTPDVVALEVRFLSANPSDAPGWSTHLAVNRPTSVPASIPLLVSQGLTDTLVRPDVTEAFVQQQCAAGATIELDTYPGVGHFEVRTVAASKVAEWMLARLQGAPVTPGCTTQAQS